MRLKATVASLIALGLSGPALGYEPYGIDAAYQMDVMRDQADKVDMILDRNQPGGFDQPCGWSCRINLSGWINTDAYLASRPPIFWGLNPNFRPNQPINLETQPPNRLAVEETGRSSDLILNNANLFLNARVNNWVNAVVSIVTTSLRGVPGTTGPYSVSNSLFVYRPVNETNLDTAYATIGNWQVSPVYLRVGKAYVPFGQYQPYAFIRQDNPTQLVAETSAPMVQLGVLFPNGFNGSVYTFPGGPKYSDGGTTRRIQNGGIDLGYGFKFCDARLDVNAGMIGNITDSNALSATYSNIYIAGTPVPGLPNRRVPAWNVNADGNVGPFDANVHYIQTTRDLDNPVYLSGYSGPGFPILAEPANLGRPRVWGLELGYTFPICARQTRLALGYQDTKHMAMFLPKRRYYIDYMFNVSKWFDIGVAVVRNEEYSNGEGAITTTATNAEGQPPIGTVIPGATGNKSTYGQLRASVKFA